MCILKSDLALYIPPGVCLDRLNNWAHLYYKMPSLQTDLYFAMPINHNVGPKKVKVLKFQKISDEC